MFGQHDFDAHFTRPPHHGIEVVHLEPEQHAIAVWLVVAITDGTVMMFHAEPVQLKDELAVPDQLLIFGTAVIAPAAEQALVPTATCFHIGYGDERLRMHSR